MKAFPSIDFMTEEQVRWYEKLIGRDEAQWSERQRAFMSDMQAASRRFQAAREERAHRESREMIAGQWGNTHPGLDSDEGWEMENPGLPRR